MSKPVFENRDVCRSERTFVVCPIQSIVERNRVNGLFDLLSSQAFFEIDHAVFLRLLVLYRLQQDLHAKPFGAWLQPDASELWQSLARTTGLPRSRPRTAFVRRLSFRVGCQLNYRSSS